MALILEVINYRGAQPLNSLTARFDENGGSVGRSYDNHLALPDEEKIISRHHGDIHHENGVFVYSDASTGGTLLCNEGRMLEKGDSVILADGDLLKIGEYEIRVSIVDESLSSPDLFSNLGNSAFSRLPEASTFDIDTPPLFSDRAPMPVLPQEPSPFQYGESASFLNQPDASPLHENFSPPSLLPKNQDDFSFDDIFREGSASTPNSPAKEDGLEFPDDWFGDLGLEPVKPEVSVSIEQKPLQCATGADSSVFEPRDDVPPQHKLVNEEEIFPELQPLNINAVDNKGIQGKLESTLLTEGKATENRSDFFSSISQSDQSPGIAGDSDIHRENLASGQGNLGKGREFSTFSEPPTPTVIDIPKPGRQSPSPKVSAVGVDSADDSSIMANTPSQPEKPLPEAGRGADLFLSFLEGAGLTEFPKISLEEQAGVMKSLGEVYREMVEGMMMILRARTKEKSEIRADRTIINRERNNPLKILPLAEDAMKIMIMRKHPSYIESTVAIREGFTDIMKHQMAMRAGIQAALGEILKRFEPSGFERRFDEGIVFQKKAKCWDAFSKAYPGLAAEAMENLLGDTFAKAYEEQMRMLRDSRENS